MTQSHTVENYLKGIYQAQLALESGRAGPDGTARVHPRRRARHRHDHGEGAVRSGLAHYEPYVGVRLTAAGEKLATTGAAPAPAD